jgi:hypothetical protein
VLPRQPCFVPRVCHTVDLAGHGDAVGARYDHRVCQQCMRHLTAQQGVRMWTPCQEHTCGTEVIQGEGETYTRTPKPHLRQNPSNGG